LDRAHGALGPVLTRRDRELEAGARAHFEDPLYYADTYDWKEDDVGYYRALARRYDRVLEQGIGSGRIALPIARDGVAITGIDHSGPMLAHLRTRLRGEDPAVRRRLTLVRGDLRRKKLGKKFPFVFCPFNTALHLYTRADVEAWLARTREHLTPGGELVFDVSMPVAKDLARRPDVAYRVPPFHHPTHGRVRYREHFDYDPVRQILFVSMFFEPTKGESFMTPLAHRQFFPREMEALLHYNGWEVDALYGDFERGPLRPDSDQMVWHVRPAKRRRR